MPNDTHVERRSSVLEVWKVVSPLPRLFRRTTEFLLSNQEQRPAEVMELILHCYQTRRNISAWREGFEKGLQKCSFIRSADHKDEANMGVSIAAQCIVQRLIVALEPHGESAPAFEEETQDLANRLLSGSLLQVNSDHPRFDLPLAQKKMIARSIVATEDPWTQALKIASNAIEPGRKHITRQIFKDWCDWLGRKIE